MTNGASVLSLSVFLKRTTAAFNKHVIRRKTAGGCITDGAVPGTSKEGTTCTDGSLFQHLVMHIAQNFIPMLNNQYQQYRCYYFPGSFSAVQSEQPRSLMRRRHARIKIRRRRSVTRVGPRAV